MQFLFALLNGEVAKKSVISAPKKPVFNNSDLWRLQLIATIPIPQNHTHRLRRQQRRGFAIPIWWLPITASKWPTTITEQRRQWGKKGGKQSVRVACSRFTNGFDEWIERVEMSSELCSCVTAMLIDCKYHNSANGTSIGRKKEQSKWPTNATKKYLNG